MSETTYKTDQSRVYGNGKSFQCTNIVTAKELACLLNKYEEQAKLNQNIDTQYDRITRQIIQLKLTINTLKEEINTLSEMITCLK